MTRALAAAAAISAAFPLLLILLVTAGAGAPAQAALSAALAGPPTALARAGIPADYLAWYMAAAKTCPGLPWSVLAGIGEAGSGHGRSALPGVRSGSDSAGVEARCSSSPPRSPGSRSTPTQVSRSARTTRPTRSTPPPRCCARTAPAAAARPGSSRRSSPTTTAGGTSGRSWRRPREYATRGSSGAAATAIAFALAQLGKPYQWGAAGPGAYDCSGLVYAAYAAAGIRIARTTYQWRQDGPVVPLSRIQPGDLLFSAGSDGTASDPGHVVMYLGDGQVISAPQTGQDVQAGPADLASVVVATRPAALAARP